MSATVLPFPITRRVAFLERQTCAVLGMKPSAATAYLKRQGEVQRDAMRRRGVPEELIDREIKAMARAVQDMVHHWLNGGLIKPAEDAV